MCIHQIKAVIRNRIDLQETRRKERLQNGDNVIVEDCVIAELRSLLESIESYEMDEY